MTEKKSIFPLVIPIYAALLCLLLSLGYGFVSTLKQQAYSQARDTAIKRSQNKMRYAWDKVLDHLEQTANMTNLLASQLHLLTKADLDYALIKQQTLALWRAELESAKIFSSFRIVDTSGKVLGRMNYDPSGQNAYEAEPEYYRNFSDILPDLRKLEPEQHLLISLPALWHQSDSAVEGVNISVIFKPLTRKDGEIIGYLAVDLDMDSVLTAIREIPGLAPGQPYILDELGFYSNAPDTNMLFGGHVPSRRHHNFAETNPEIWREMNRNAHGILDTEKEIFVYTRHVREAEQRGIVAILPHSTYFSFKQLPVTLLQTVATNNLQPFYRYLGIVGVAIALLLLPLSMQLASTLRRAREGRLAQAVLNANVPLMITDTEGRIVDINRRFIEVSGYPRDELMGQDARILGTAQQTPEFYQQFWSTLKRNGTWSGEITNRKKDGSELCQLMNVTALRNKRGRVKHYVATYTDISCQKQIERKLRESSIRDPLTGCLNRRGLVGPLTQSIELNKRHQTPFCLALLDIDHFKNINDSYGHDAGDEVLKLFVESVQAELRQTDLLARVGGEEFVVLMPVTPVPGAVQLLQRIQQRLTGTCRDISFTFSAGVTAGMPEDDRDSIQSRADKALYAAKGAGRDQVMTIDGSGSAMPAKHLLCIVDNQPVADANRSDDKKAEMETTA